MFGLLKISFLEFHVSRSNFIYWILFACIVLIFFFHSSIYLYYVGIHLRNLLGGCLHGNSERPFNEAMEVKVGTHWKPYGIGDARAVGCLLRRAVLRGWDQPRRQKCEADKEVPFDIGHRVIGCGVCPSWFRSYFVPVFCHNDPFPPFFWNKNVFSLPLNGGSM